MDEEEMKREINYYLQQREETTEKLKNYAYELYKMEANDPNPNIGWKRMLRELGFVI